MNYTQIQGTTAKEIVGKSVILPYNITATSYQNQQQLLESISDTLLDMEKQLEVDVVQVQELQSKLVWLFADLEERKTLERRCEWLFKLAKYKQNLPSYSSVSKMTEIMTQLEFCPRMPLKLQLQEQLAERIQELRKQEGQPTKEDWINRMFEEQHMDFIKLGTFGYNLVVEKAMKDEAATTELIGRYTENLLTEVEQLKEKDDSYAYELYMTEWQLPEWNHLQEEDKEAIVASLIKSRQWTGFASFFQMYRNELEQLLSQEKSAVEQSEFYVDGQTTITITEELRSDILK